MNEQLRMALLSVHTLFEQPPEPQSDSEIIAYLTAAVIILLRERGGEDDTELAHLTAEAAISGRKLNEYGKNYIRSLINNEGEENAEVS